MARSPGKPTQPKKPRKGKAPADERRTKTGARVEARANGAAKSPARAASKTTVKRRAVARGAPEDPRPAGTRRREGKALRARSAPPAEPPTRVLRQADNPSPLARSVSGFDEQPAADPGAQSDHDGVYRLMELHWDDDAPPSVPANDIVTRWVKRGDMLLRHLAEHGAARHEYRADLKDGRFVWIDPEGRVSAEAKARVICSWSPTTSALVMAWADPLVRSSGISRIDGAAAERDDVDEEEAWHVAMEAAESARAEYLYRVTTPDAWYFLALSSLTFAPGRSSFSPSTPVGLVLRGLGEARRAVESRAEPTDVVRDRLAGFGRALVHEAEYAYRGTDWVSRLERTGRRLVTLADRLPRATFKSVAAGRPVDEWLGREATIDLSQALSLLEDEWALFA
ncbi:MAG: hypothetical protein QM820_52995 [Minicystis sp.]